MNDTNMYYTNQLISDYINDLKFEKEKNIKDSFLFNLNDFSFVPEIEEVIFHNPATIVRWVDGTKTVVKCQNGDVYNKESGFALCIVKKIMGNKSNFNNLFRKWCA